MPHRSLLLLHRNASLPDRIFRVDEIPDKRRADDGCHGTPRENSAMVCRTDIDESVHTIEAAAVAFGPGRRGMARGPPSLPALRDLEWERTLFVVGPGQQAAIRFTIFLFELQPSERTRVRLRDRRLLAVATWLAQQEAKDSTGGVLDPLPYVVPAVFAVNCARIPADALPPPQQRLVADVD